MPRVPTYGGPKVKAAPVPAPASGGGGGSRAVSAAALGAGYEESKIRRFEALSNLGQQAAGQGLALLQNVRQEQEQVKTQANQYAVLKATNQLDMWENATLFDKDKGVMAQQGEASFPLPELTLKEYDKTTGDIAKGLGNDDQRLAFEKIRLERRARLDYTVRSHVSQQMIQATGHEMEAGINNATSRAIAAAEKPAVVWNELNKAVTLLEVHGPAIGMGKEQIAQEKEKIRTAVHGGVITTLIDRKLVPAAKAYYEETQGSIAGAAQGRIEAALKVGDVDHQAQLYADAISDSEFARPLSEQIALLKDQVPDPEVRKAAQGLIEHAYAIREKEKADNEEATLRGAFDLIEQSKDFNSIPVALRATLDGNQRAALRNYAEHLAAGTKIVTDLPTYYSLMQKAANNPITFARENLLKYKDKLDETEFKEIARLQLSLRNGENKDKTDTELAGFRTRNQIVDDTLIEYGLDPNAKAGTPEAKAIASLRRMLDLRVSSAQMPDAAGKRKQVTNVEIQQTLDELLTMKGPITVPGSFWNLLPYGKPLFDTPGTKRLMNITIAEVPTPARDAIRAKLTAAGRPSDDENVLAVYRESLVK